MEILAEHMAQAARNVGFPEMAHCTMLSLRDFAKRTPVERFRTAARGVLAAVEANNLWLGSARASVDFAPKDSIKVGEWDPSAVVGGTVRMQDGGFLSSENCLQCCLAFVDTLSAPVEKSVAYALSDTCILSDMCV